MSAIWGFISLSKNNTDIEQRITHCRELMKAPYEECKIDRFEEKTFDNGFFACGIQYFNKRARSEALPYYDKDSDTVFTADVVLNNRKNTVAELQKEGFKDVSMETPDGELAYMAWKKWGCAFTEHIMGLFAAAVYDRKNDSFYLFTDHTGCRCVDYSICGDELFFSTLSRPVVEAMPQEYRGFDEKFIVGCEASTTAYMYVFPDRTPFKNVYHTVRGNYIRAKAQGSGWDYYSVEYYVPGTVKASVNPPKDPRDPYYRKVFRDVFFECVRDAIDTDGEVAATISSGLDSSSVATVAATFMQEDNRTLHGYTSVPMKGFVYTKKNLDMPDESPGVKNIVAGYPNIEQQYCDCDGMSSFTEMDELVHIFEIPGKAFLNQVWIKYIVKDAAKRGCKMLLNGQYGNFTISKGSMMEHFFQKLFTGNLVETKNQLAKFGEKNGVPRKLLFTNVVKEMWKEFKFRLGINHEFDDVINAELGKASLIKKHKVKKVLRKRFGFYGFTDVKTEKRMFRNLGDINILQTQGLYDTKYSLYYGIMFRDPTKDIRLMELIAALPSEQYVYNGLERRLVREYLDDMIPDRERLQVRYKGRQSADRAMRLKAFGDDHTNEQIDTRVYDYMVREKVSEMMAGEIDEENALDIVRVIALNRFIKEFSKSFSEN